MARSCCFCLLRSSAYVHMTANGGAIRDLHCMSTVGAVWLGSTSAFNLCDKSQMTRHI